jgi:hypothetical protein
VKGASLRDAMNNFCDWFSTERRIPNGMQMQTTPNCIVLNGLLYYRPLKFPLSTSIYPLGKQTPVLHCRVFSVGLGINSKQPHPVGMQRSVENSFPRIYCIPSGMQPQYRRGRIPTECDEVLEMNCFYRAAHP